jgi:hypothetical protein
MRPDRAISGHVFRVDGKRHSVWRAKYRLPDGRQVQTTIGRVWTERGRPPEGYFTRRIAQRGCARSSTRPSAACCPEWCARDARSPNGRGVPAVSR